MTDVETAVNETDAPKPKRRLQVYRFSDAPTLEATGRMEPGPLSEEITDLDLADLAPKIGYEARVLFADDVKDHGVSLVHAWFGPGYPLPSHTHNADCLYYIVRGSVLLGPNELVAGDGFFVPTDTPYRYEAGPEGVEILEFRNDTHWDIQWVDQNPERWKAYAERGKERRDAWLEAYEERPLK